MTFGYENEYFLRRGGKILHEVPDYSIPHDAYSTLVEVRSDPFDDPLQVLESFKLKYKELEAMVAKHNCELVNLPQYMIGNRLETAGFHIHFSTAAWQGLDWKIARGAEPPDDIRPYITRLDGRFKKYFENVKRHPHYWRPKSHGWEYRRLPATTDPEVITQVLIEEFKEGSKA